VRLLNFLPLLFNNVAIFVVGDDSSILKGEKEEGRRYGKGEGEKRWREKAD